MAQKPPKLDEIRNLRLLVHLKGVLHGKKMSGRNGLRRPEGTGKFLGITSSNRLRRALLLGKTL
jgi:hypothetical protein